MINAEVPVSHLPHMGQEVLAYKGLRFRGFPGLTSTRHFKCKTLGPYSRRNSFQIIPLRLYDFFYEFVNWELEIENWASNIFTVGADK